MKQQMILLAEGDVQLRETLAYALRGEDFLVITAADGEMALDVAAHNPLSLVILATTLPRLDGLDVCRRLRARTATAHVPILLLTTEADETAKVVGFEMGADDVVTKPVSWAELRARVRVLLRRSELRADADVAPFETVTTHERILEVSGLHIDVDCRVVTRCGADVVLKRRVFDLLVYMVRYRGAVLSRDRLLGHVWGYAYSGDVRTVDVHVRWLREKLETDPAHPTLIQTVHGVGYRLRDEVTCCATPGTT